MNVATVTAPTARVRVPPEHLAALWLQAKAREDNAAGERIAIENQLIAALGAREEGSETHHLGGYKIVITGKLERSVTAFQWEKVKGDVPNDLCPIKPVTTYKADPAGCRWLKANRPDIYAIVARALTIKPRKTAVTVETI